MTHTFSLLHISDLHERGSREKERYRRQRVLGDSWRQNLDDLCQEGGIDVVCFTGDLADRGKAEEYERINPFLDGLLGHLKLDRSRLFVVPGNHDIDRSVSLEEWRQLRGNLGNAKPLELSRWMERGQAPWGFQDAWRDAVLSRQASYHGWLKQFGLAAQIPCESGRLLGYRVPLRLPGLPFNVQVIGLDSAWLCGDDADSGKLRLTDGQVQTLCADPEEGRPWDGFRLALVHHPLSDLADRAECQRLLAKSVDLLLRGHLHDTAVDLWADPDHSLRAIAAGCLYEGHSADHYPNSCILIRVTCDEAGRPLRYALRFRCFSPRGSFWSNDTGLYRESQNGTLIIDPAAEKAIAPASTLTPPPLRTEAPAPPPPAVTPPLPAPAPLPAPVAPPLQLLSAGSSHPLPANTQIDGYRIVRLLGQGGMGAVYEAVKVSIGHRVAIKFLYGAAVGQADIVRRFVNEARSSSRIDHPAIVEIFEAGQAPDGSPYLVMELVRGETLAARILRFGAEGMRLPVPQAIQVAWQVAVALVATHTRGIVHRDLKPDNIMLVPDAISASGERVKLLDFGIAKLTQDLTEGQPATAANQLLGTPMYMSPEQCRSAAAVDARSDVYSLGVILYEILAGRPPFQADQLVQFLAQHLFEPPPPLSAAAPSLPAGLAELVHQMLNKDREQRPAMYEVAERLQGYLAGTSGGGRLLLGRHKRSLLIGAVLLPLTGFAAVANRQLLGRHVHVSPAASQPASRPAAAPRTVRWRVDSNPPGATVFGADGRWLGLTPWESTVEARPGTSQLQLKLPGYEASGLNLDQSRDEDRTVPLRLLRVPGTITY